MSIGPGPEGPYAAPDREGAIARAAIAAAEAASEHRKLVRDLSREQGDIPLVTNRVETEILANRVAEAAAATRDALDFFEEASEADDGG